MRKTTSLCLALFPFLLTGCMTIRRSRVLTITPEPGVTRITVAADAVAKCFNLILVELCSLDLNLRQVGGGSVQSPQGKKVRDYILARYDRIAGQLVSGSGDDLAALLDLLKVPPPRQVEAILMMKELRLRARNDPADFAALAVDSLLKFQ